MPKIENFPAKSSGNPAEKKTIIQTIFELHSELYNNARMPNNHPDVVYPIYSEADLSGGGQQFY